MISAMASSAVSAPSPSADSTTSSPCIAPSVIRPSTLAASTGWPSSLRMVTLTGWPAAAFASSAAGRAWSPTLLATVTRRSGMIRPFLAPLGESVLQRLAGGRGGLGGGDDAGVGLRVLVVLAAGGVQVPLGDDEPEQEVVDHRVDQAHDDEQVGLGGDVPVQDEVDRTGREREA